VLRVRSPAGSVLLAGDIEAAQERRLIELFGADGLRSDWLLAPHHGSATSSSQPFLEAVSPRWAVFQVGYRNRYRHPNAAVAGRYEAQGVEALRSDAHGAITFRMSPGRDPQIARARLDDGRYWRVGVETAAPREGPVAPERAGRVEPLLGRPAAVDAP
jgi:competence protein ComEC